LTWSDVLAGDKGQVQLSFVGKGGVVRQVLLPEAVSRALVSLRGDAGANDLYSPVARLAPGSPSAPCSASSMRGGAPASERR
jgi:hypothetical protein